MAFPDSPRVIYKDNTLEEVVCQVKFPTILKISEVPVEFQERIRGAFPLLEQKPAIELPPEIPPDMARVMASRVGNVSHFLSRDRVWDASLFREFLALTCTTYTRWEEFRRHFEVPFRALTEIYSPTFYTRIGLRYRNIIRRSKLGLGGVPWSELLRPEICGELAAPGIGDAVEQASRELVVIVDEGRKVRLAHGLAEGGDSYVIDADFFTDSEVEATNVAEQLDAFNRESGRLIRWAISNRLHAALGPTAI